MTAPNSADILLCTLNSTYQHSSFGLRYLYANLEELQPRALILESTIKDNPRNFAERILGFRPRIVGLSVYIWNTLETLEVIMLLKKVAPEVVIILGGPEISHETAGQPHLQWADYVIAGEADFLFRDLCRELLAGQRPAGPSHSQIGGQVKAQILAGDLPAIGGIRLPYAFYTDDDIRNRVIYVEASRGCPYKCEYCLSSLDKSVRSFDLEVFLAEMKTLLDRGARTFKFVDRTFNLSPTTSTRILAFFLEHVELGLFLHFELVPDRLPSEIRELIQRFPAGSLQFEIGIQTLNPEVAQNISRRNDLTKVAENFRYLREDTGVHTHADLIVGLPGETLESFAAGFDRLAAWGPDEIQVGILKRLKGTPIARHEESFRLAYSEAPPFQILSTRHMDFTTLQKMNRFAKFWDLYANSGEFPALIARLRHGEHTEGSFFWSFFRLSEYLSASYRETHSISLLSLAEKAFEYLKLLGIPENEAAKILDRDYCGGADSTQPRRRERPPFLKKVLGSTAPAFATSAARADSRQARQTKHLN